MWTTCCPNSIFTYENITTISCFTRSTAAKYDVICKNPQLRMFNFLQFCTVCALSFVILQYEACIINSFKLTMLGSSRCVIYTCMQS